MCEKQWAEEERNTPWTNASGKKQKKRPKICFKNDIDINKKTFLYIPSIILILQGLGLFQAPWPNPDRKKQKKGPKIVFYIYGMFQNQAKFQLKYEPFLSDPVPYKRDRSLITLDRSQKTQFYGTGPQNSNTKTKYLLLQLIRKVIQIQWISQGEGFRKNEKIE